MARISLSGFKDPVRRPRYIIWTGAVVLLLAAFVITALGVTSTYWFCAEVCHKVQDDTIEAYNRSTHSEISCMACHMPVNANPIIFVLHKAEALGELYLTATDNFELPLNGESHVAMTMSEGQCTQCHSANRIFTPSSGIIIDHAIHSENEVQCTLCHNRIAHREDFELTLKDPESGETNRKHADFMTMTACFRCHGLEADAKAPGACAACHPADFPLKPDSHLQKTFFPAGHADLAIEDLERMAEAAAEGEGGEAAEGEAEEPSEEGTGTPSEEGTESKDGAFLGLEEAYASGGGGSKWAEELPAVEEVSYCSTCHLKAFCSNCHGMDMPHPEEFKTKTHPELVKTKLDKCEYCHKQSTTNFCNNCHHGTASKWTFDAKVAWQTQHAAAVTKNGTAGCLEKCHEKKYCFDCHTKLKPVPGSHAAADWLRKPVEALGVHAEAFKAQPSSCEICHGENLPNRNSFCTKCHVLEMPHPQDFKQFHAKTGRDNPAVCANCHTFKELCSDCHHEGASDAAPWLQVHGGAVNKNGTKSCFEKCHEKKFCVDCHTSKKVVPASHNQAGWTTRAKADTPALHPATYDKQPDNCTYCHGEGGPTAAFCNGCHKIEMPHPADFKDTHKAQFQAKKLDKAVCNTCHQAVFCNKCHHPDYTGAKPWVNEHPEVVKKKGATPCFDCHEETYCSYCHVRQASQYLNN